MIANLVPVVVLAAVLIGYFVYMKFFYPRFRQRCEAAADRAELGAALAEERIQLTCAIRTGSARSRRCSGRLRSGG